MPDNRDYRQHRIAFNIVQPVQSFSFLNLVFSFIFRCDIKQEKYQTRDKS